jgi:hypothetical protein
MAKISAVQCDLKSCGKLDSPTDGAEIPYGWLLVDYYQEGEGSLEGRVFCSWKCASGWAGELVAGTPRRKRRTRAEMAADRARAAARTGDSATQ